MQLLSPEPEPAAAAQPGACMWPASLPLLPPHPLIHAFSPRSCAEPHIAPPAHPRTPGSPVRLEDAAPPGSSPASVTARAVQGGEKGLPPVRAGSAAATCSVCSCTASGCWCQEWAGAEFSLRSALWIEFFSR